MRNRLTLAALVLCACVPIDARSDAGALALAAPSPTSSTSPPRDFLIEEANALLYEREFGIAEHLANLALQDDPNNADAHLVRAMVQWMRGQFEASAATTRLALALDPSSYSVVYHLARILRAQGRLREVLTIFDDWRAAVGPCTPEARCAPADECEAKLELCRKASAKLSIVQLEVEYLLADASAMLETAAELERVSDCLDPRLLNRPARLSELAHWLEPHAPLVQVEGERGVLRSVEIDPSWNTPAGAGRVADLDVHVVYSLTLHDTLISEPLAEALELEPLATLVNRAGEPVDVVLIDRLSLGGLDLRQVPAWVYAIDDPSDRTLVLGRQVSQQLGALTFDLSAAELVIDREVPALPEGVTRVPLLGAELGQATAPLVPVHIGGTNPALWLWFGMEAPTPLILEHQLLRGRVRAQPDASGQMTIDKLRIGDRQLGPIDAQVSDQVFGRFGTQVLDSTLLPFAGALSYDLISTWRATYLPTEGSLWLGPPPPHR